MKFNAVFFATIFLTTLLRSGWSAGDSTLVHDGDRWVCLGDSITAQDTYRRILDRVFKHYHLDATLTVVNSGQAGDTASDNPAKLAKRVLDHQPTIVSVMYGMNEAINNYSKGSPKEKVLAIYRRSLTYIAKTLKEHGITVLLMSPTLTDPSAHSFFTLDKSQPFLRECAKVVREVAQAEGVEYVPVQEEFEAFHESLPLNVALAPDGVHPAALGQYQIARSLWEHAGFARPLGKGERSLARVPAGVPVTVKLASRFVKTDATGIELILNAAEPMVVTATWSLGSLRKTETLSLTTGENHWTIAIPNDALPARNGQAADLVFDLRNGAANSLFIVDLTRTQVLHFKDNVISGTVESETDREEGKVVANWQAERVDDNLLLTFEVFDKEINPDGLWPYSRDGLNLVFDYRPTERFADIGLDREVMQLFLDVREKPFFSVGVRAWTGLGMDFAATAAGEKTPTGYKVRLLINNRFNLHTPSKLAKRDFIGLLVSVIDKPAPGESGGAIISNQKNDLPISAAYANNLPILDLKDQLPGDATITAHLYPSASMPL